MAIRLRVVDGHLVALCAAATKEQLGDRYLDDTVHHALATKFALDFESEGLCADCAADPVLAEITRREEAREAWYCPNCNRRMGAEPLPTVCDCGWSGGPEDA